MAITFNDDAVEQVALGIGPQGEPFGIFAGLSNPWDVVTEAPQNSIYFKTDGTVWHKAGTGYTQSDWSPGVGSNAQETIEILDSGVEVETGAIKIDFLKSIAATTPATGEVDIQLVGDVLTPGADKVYGTNGSGDRGWYDAAAAGEIAIEYGESEGTSSRTFTSYYNKVSKTFTAEASDYLIFWTAEVYSSDSGTRVKTLCEVDNTTTVNEVDWHPDTSQITGFGPASGFRKLALAAGSRTIDLDYASTQSGKSVSIRRARVYAVKVL